MIERSEFENQFIYLRKIILDGISYFIVWQALNREYEDSISIHVDKNSVWRQYNGFFAPVRNALLWSTLMQLSKAFDRNSKTVSLINLLIKTRNNAEELSPYATQDELEAIQARIAKNSQLLDKLWNYRNKRLAHYDSTEMQILVIPSDEVNTLVEETKAILNLFKYACEGQSDTFEDIMANVTIHTSQVIGILNTGEKLG